MSFVTISRTRNKSFVEAVLAQDAAALAAQEQELQRRVRLEVNKLREAALAEAKAAGEAQARDILAVREAALAQAQAALEAAGAQLCAPLAQKERDLAELVLELGFLLARHIAGDDAGTAPPGPPATAQAGLAGLVGRLLAEAAAERGPRQSLRLRLNPADRATLADRLSADAAELVADDKIAPGGALVELLTPDGDPLDKAEWDATLEGRTHVLRTALGLPESPAL